MAGPANPAASTQPNVFQQSAGAYNAALQGTSAAGAYRPQMVNTQFGYNPANVAASNVGTQFGYNPANVAAQSAVGGIQTYMNPYTQSVVDTSMADLERQRQMQTNALGAQATQARAFGGSRQGVAEALTNEAFARQGGQLAAGLRQAGFNTALGAAQQDTAASLQAALANQAAGSRAAEFGQQTGLQAQGMNQQVGLQAALANQAAQAQAQQFGQQTGLQAALANQQAGLQGAQFGLSAANQMSGLAGQGFGFGQQIGQQQMQQGAMQQMLNQQLIDAARAQYGGFVGAPQQSLGLPMAAVGAGNMGQQTQTTSQTPGLFNYLALALGA
jgi:hypothetical protein